MERAFFASVWNVGEWVSQVFHRSTVPPFTSAAAPSGSNSACVASASSRIYGDMVTRLDGDPPRFRYVSGSILVLSDGNADQMDSVQ
jgi:hypothetical protein